MTSLARRTDPSSSHFAIKDLFETDRLGPQEQAAADLVRAYPGNSYKQLYSIHVRDANKPGGKLVFSDATALMRRLKKAAHGGEKKYCRLCNREVKTWWPK